MRQLEARHNLIKRALMAFNQNAWHEQPAVGFIIKRAPNVYFNEIYVVARASLFGVTQWCNTNSLAPFVLKCFLQQVAFFDLKKLLLCFPAIALLRLSRS
jgi:hypothetical protein